jgi:hypothetical protein
MGAGEMPGDGEAAGDDAGGLDDDE